MTAVVLDEFTANEMLDYPDVFQDAGSAFGLSITPTGLTKGGSALTAGERDSVKVGLGAGRPKFIDSFRRADTAAGSIGAGWTVKGPYAGGYPLPAGTDGEINSMGVECPAGVTTYFTRTLPATPKQLQAKVSWLDLANGQTGYQTFAMICTASANLIDDMGLHITLAHTTLRVQERIAGGAFVDLFAAVDIQPRLSLADGENILTVEIDAANNAGVVHLNERTYEFSSPNLSGHIGPIVSFEWSQSGGALNRYRGRVLEFSAY